MTREIEVIEVQVKRLHPERDADIPFPRYMTEGSAGCDLSSAVDAVIPVGKSALILTGLAIAIPAGYEAQIRPRSGLALRQGITVLNAPGTHDSDYRGEMGVILINHGHEPFYIKRGDRIAQMVLAPVTRAGFVEVESLPETARGAGGYGHTGAR